MRRCMKPLCQTSHVFGPQQTVAHCVARSAGATRQIRTFRKARAEARKNRIASQQSDASVSSGRRGPTEASSAHSNASANIPEGGSIDFPPFEPFEPLHAQTPPDDHSPGLSRFHASDLFLHTSSATPGWSNAWVEETDSDDGGSRDSTSIDEMYLSASDPDTTEDADEDAIWVKAKSPSSRPFSHIPSKEELNRQVQLSIEKFLPANVRNMPTRSSAKAELSSTKQSEESESDVENLTPSQQFYRENKDLLLHRAQRYFAEKHDAASRKIDALSEEEPKAPEDEDALFNRHFGKNADESVDKEWEFYRDPVVRPPKGHAWDFGNVLKPLKKEDLDFQIGKMPSVEQIVKFLRQEAVTNITVVDLEEVGRRDLGSYAIIGTCKTTRHCHKTAKRVCHTVSSLDIPFISASTYCWGSRGDAWVTSHCGPLKIHCLTTEERGKLELERFWSNPEESRIPGDFAAYTDQEPIPDAASPHVLDHRFSKMKKGAQVPEVLEANYEALKRNDDYRSPSHPNTSYFDAESGRMVQVQSVRDVKHAEVTPSPSSKKSSVTARIEEKCNSTQASGNDSDCTDKPKRRNR